MAATANVFAINALDELRGALNRFGGEAQGSLGAAELEIRRAFDWLQERQIHWQNEVHRRIDQVRQAQAAFARCQASGYTDPQTGRQYVPDCSAYADAMLSAQVHLREAESELRTCQDWGKILRNAVSDYQRQAQRLSADLGNDLPKATALLGRATTTLYSYAAIGLSHDLGSVPSGAATNTTPGAAPDLNEPDPSDTPGSHPENAGGVERERGHESVDGAQRGVEHGG